MMAFLFPVFALTPVLAIVAFLYLWAKGERTGLSKSSFCFIFLGVVGAWSISQSNASTSAISFLFLPFFMSVGASGIWAYENYKNNAVKNIRFASMGGLIVAVLCMAMLLWTGYTEKKNTQFEENKELGISLLTAQYRQDIEKALSVGSTRNATEVLHDLMLQHADDPTYLSAILDFSDVSAADLKFLYESQRVSPLSILRHKSVTPVLIEEIYKGETNKDSILGDLAYNPGTPEWILKEIFDAPNSTFAVGTYDHFYAQNPATPFEILEVIAERSKKQFVILQLLKNAKIDCTIVKAVKVNLAKSDKPDDKETLDLLTHQEAVLCTK